MIITNIKTIYINLPSDLEKFLNDFKSNIIHYEQINLKLSKHFIQHNLNNQETLINFNNINSMQNVYVTAKINNNLVSANKLIKIIPEKIIKLKFNSSDDYTKLNSNELINLKKLFLQGFNLDENIIEFLCRILENNTNLEDLYISSNSYKDKIYYEVFLSKIANSLKKNKNLQNFTININNILTEINNRSCSYSKYYQEIIDLIISNRYTSDKLIILHKDLKKYIKELERTKEIYVSIGETNNIISLAINNSEVIIEEKTITYNNALQFAINNIKNNQIIAEAIYNLAEETQLTDPLESYRILTNIPANFEEIYKKSNYLMAHILLSMEEHDYKKIEIPNLQHNKSNKMQMIISHLSESGTEDKDLLNKILNEYVFNNGIVESKDNPFELIPIEKNLFPKTCNLLFILNAWKKHEENLNKTNKQESYTQPKKSKRFRSFSL